MKKIAILLSSFCFAFLTSSNITQNEKHPFHLSICDMEENETESVLEISMKIFIDDLLKAISEEGFLDKESNIEEMTAAKDKIVAAYLAKHFAIKINSTICAPKYMGFEIDDDAIWTFLEVKNTGQKIRSLTIRNSILFSSFPTQNNIINAKIGGTKKSLIFFSQKYEGDLSFP